MKRLFVLILAVILLTSCSEKKETTVDRLNEFFSQPLIATSSDEKFSFEIHDGKIRVIYPEILKGTEVFFENDEIKTNLYGTPLKLPESSMVSVKSLLLMISKIKANDISIEEKDGIIKIEQHTFKISNDEITFSSMGRTFTIKKLKNNTEQK